jgi:hypothetical protein
MSGTSSSIVDIDLLINSQFKRRVSHGEHKKTAILNYLDADDNSEILHLLKERLKLGFTRYKHGVRIDEDTRTHGTKTNDWEEMYMEEALDGLIYITASIIRHRRAKRLRYNNTITNDDSIIDDYRKVYKEF